MRFYNPRQLARQANRQVRASIQAQQAPIKTAQAQADQRAAAAQEALKGFGLAAAGILAKSAPLAGQAYQQAAAEESQLAGGYSQQAAQAVQQHVASSQALIDQLAPGGAATSPNTSGMADALYAQGGYIPGAANEQQAAIAITHASEQPGISAGQTQQDLVQAQAKQAIDDQQYTQQMLDLAASKPELRSQIMQQLQQNEMAKRAAWVQEQAQQSLTGYRGAELGLSQRRINVAERQGNARLALSAADLKLREAADQRAVRQALIQGHRIDSSASHAAGYLIDRNGNPILGKGGKQIPVQSSSGSSGSNAGVGSSGYHQAVRAVHTLLVPAPVPNAGGKNPYAGSYKYLAKPGQGTFVQGYGWYTNDAKQAVTQPKYAFPRAVVYLANAYGISRKAARKALVLGGYPKPNGQRP
jgi:hypothetical protein